MAEYHRCIWSCHSATAARADPSRFLAGQKILGLARFDSDFEGQHATHHRRNAGLFHLDQQIGHPVRMRWKVRWLAELFWESFRYSRGQARLPFPWRQCSAQNCDVGRCDAGLDGLEALAGFTTTEQRQARTHHPGVLRRHGHRPTRIALRVYALWRPP